MVKPLLLISLLSMCVLTGLSRAQDAPDPITAWLRQQAVPLKSTRPGKDFADLQPLQRILQDVRVVGLGEATHGTRESRSIHGRQCAAHLESRRAGGPHDHFGTLSVAYDGIIFVENMTAAANIKRESVH